MTGGCPTCGRALQAIGRAPGERRSGPITVSVDARTMNVCPMACGRPDDAMVAAVRRAVRGGLSLATGRPRAARCGRCRAVLDLPMRATTRSVTVESDAADPFTLTFHLPLVRCGECGSDNVPAELTDAVERSALDACGVGDARGADDEGGPVRGLLRLLRRRGGPGSPARP